MNWSKVEIVYNNGQITSIFINMHKQSMLPILTNSDTVMQIL
jgi:hypothetical protein